MKDTVEETAHHRSVMDSEAGRLLKALSGRVLDTLLPPQCLSCSAPIAEPGNLCGDCWEHVRFLTAPMCSACGHPFDFDPGPDALCGACLRDRPLVRRARAVFAYDEASKPMVLSFKHADRTDAAPAFARWMFRAAPDLVCEAEVIVPVPLHWTRLWSRRYNQAALLAQGIAKLSGMPYLPRLLRRHRRTRSQGHLSRAGRRRNVAGAFRLDPSGRERVKGRRVLLIDDVTTTGATAEACARVLLRSGAASVDLLTLARVVRPS